MPERHCYNTAFLLHLVRDRKGYFFRREIERLDAQNEIQERIAFCSTSEQPPEPLNLDVWAKRAMSAPAW